ncbi:MAG: hypothetical protein ACKVIH_09940, partial [Burkholderiales bacterium]
LNRCLLKRVKSTVMQAKILASVFDAGSACAHRGYAPSLDDALAAMEALENLLHQQVLLPRVEAMRANTPQRGHT